MFFTAEDLARTRIALPGPLAESQLSLRMLQSREEKPLFDGWRGQVRPRVPPDARELAGFLANPRGWMVDLFTLLGPASSIEEGRERLLRAPRQRLREELSLAPGLVRRRPSWLTDLGPGAVVRLTSALVEYHAVAVAPYWDRMLPLLHAHAQVSGRLMATGGVSAVLESLAPLLRWHTPVLEVPAYSSWRGSGRRDYHLGGRGVILAPSLFCGPLPHLFEPPSGDAAALLIYPVPRDVAGLRNMWSSPRSPGSDKALAELLGTKRAAILAALADSCTTTELARVLSISPSSVSQHTGVLRRAGLISSTRYRNTVHHYVTPLGLALLGH